MCRNSLSDVRNPRAADAKARDNSLGLKQNWLSLALFYVYSVQTRWQQSRTYSRRQ
jgi:hypothetical protein